MKIKPGVDLLGIKPELLVGLQVAERVFRDYQEELILTSVVDGTHKMGSLHYKGLAFDSRIPTSVNNSDLIMHDLKIALGNNYDVVNETNHIHIEYDKKS